MKKLFALILSAAMIISLASVSFAFDSCPLEILADQPGKYDEDTNEMWSGMVNFEYGDTVYFAVGDTWDYGTGSGANSKFYENLKIKTTFEEGGNLVESVKLVKVNVGGEEPCYCYYIALKIADKATYAETDIIGEFEANRKAVKIDGEEVSPRVKDLKAEFGFSVHQEHNWIDHNDYLVDGDKELVIKYDEAYALKFDCDDEIELQFGDYEGGYNEGTFTVDVSGQGKLFIEWNTDADEAIAAANEGAEMRFVNFGGVKFHRAGEFVYELDDAAAAYEIAAGKLIAIPGAEIGDDEIVFRTNKLGSYVFAKSELVNP